MQYLIFFLLSYSGLVFSAQMNKPGAILFLREKVELAGMMAKDQTLREEIMNEVLHKNNHQISDLSITYLHQIDKENTLQLKKIIKSIGWPSQKMMGRKYSDIAWLLVVHADDDIAFQREILNIFSKNKKMTGPELKHFSYLFDRVKTKENNSQRYGTQGKCIKGQGWQPFPIEDRAQLNKRRSEVGLASFETYQKFMQKFCP